MNKNGPLRNQAHFTNPDSSTYLCSNFFRTLRPDSRKIYSRFLAWRLLELYREPSIWNFQQQTTGIINLNIKDYLKQRFLLPEKPEQVRIADVLDTMDEAIAKWQSVIGKLRWVRAGLLHVLRAPSTSFWLIDVEPLSAIDLRSDGKRWSLRAGAMPRQRRI